MASVDSVIQTVTRKDAGGTVCSDDLASGPWAFDLPGRASYGPGASEHDSAPGHAPLQPPIPAEYRDATSAEIESRIRRAKQALGEQVVILGHHYQRDEIIQFADFLGDSFKLARLAQTRAKASYIVFCGVHFMAEGADILSGADQTVILPNLAAGCSMADMADADSVLDCWEQLDGLLSGSGEGKVPLLPVTYMNSSADLKAFCGEHGGIVCTSSNARAVLEWAFERSERVLFFPDQHLGRNTGKQMGIPLNRMPLWDPARPLGGNDEAALDRASIILWRGWCSVHERFTAAQVERARERCPGVSIIVHPECSMEVVDLADIVGSTEHIISTVEKAPPGAVWAIGTEINLVHRLANEHPEQTIWCLDPVICPCSTMYRIHPAYLCWVLERLVMGEVVNRISVEEETRRWARIALERMLAVGGAAAAHA
jgi:quinolinate synthase